MLNVTLFGSSSPRSKATVFSNKLCSEIAAGPDQQTGQPGENNKQNAPNRVLEANTPCGHRQEVEGGRQEKHLIRFRYSTHIHIHAQRLS